MNIKKSIWKYSLDTWDAAQLVAMPDAAKIRHVGIQDGNVCILVESCPSNPVVNRYFVVRGTGHSVEDGEEYVGTAIDRGSSFDAGFVWHVFEKCTFLK